jgi:hypothetical protein
MADWLQTRRELTCLDAVSRFGPVCVGAINAVTGMPASCIHQHLQVLQDNGRIASYAGHDLRSGDGDVALWIVADPAPRAGWCSETLVLFCGDEPPSTMEAEDAVRAEEDVI